MGLTMDNCTILSTAVSYAGLQLPPITSRAWNTSPLIFTLRLAVVTRWSLLVLPERTIHATTQCRRKALDISSQTVRFVVTGNASEAPTMTLTICFMRCPEIFLHIDHSSWPLSLAIVGGSCSPLHQIPTHLRIVTISFLEHHRWRIELTSQRVPDLRRSPCVLPLVAVSSGPA
ncbi:hypothetical protein A0H81_09273 [Grifola frondosa]|uniref:Uncharacterized protein n=1 Tax=Grifola frondosa TaxID=5627 RepID=A0A1C7M2F6_GRIFR|nr:hypothetical protein A0H81_09273 [Grifola frondosa]